MSISVDMEAKRLTNKFAGKTLKSIEIDDENICNYLNFKFTDKSELKIDYD
jgi:hypothetical protein